MNPVIHTKSFRQVFDRYNWDEVQSDIAGKDASDVRKALASSKRDLEDFKALISPAALPFLDQMAGLSRQLTLQRFGKVIQLYAPLYVSNECHNICTYCGFSMDNALRRKTLDDRELLAEAAFLKGKGYDSVLLVSGEAAKTVDIPYFEHALGLVRPLFSQVSLEVQPLTETGYRQLTRRGLYGVLVYQETYRKQTYAACHPRGRKSNFYHRLETPDRLGKAGVHKIGLGALLGLDDWRTDSFFTALHLCYLERTYWKSRYSISFPRLRPCAGSGTGSVPTAQPVSDRELVQLICAYRLLNGEVELSLSTRESPHFRDHVIRLGINSMSAGSKTNPGGYTTAPDTLEQFATDDMRSPAQIARMLEKQGYQPVWKDWDQAFDRRQPC